MSKQVTAKQLRMFAKEVGIESIAGYTKTKAIETIISRTNTTSQYTSAFINWYKQLDNTLFNKKGKILRPNISEQLKVFSIDTYTSWDIAEQDHRKKFICTSLKGDSFEFSIDINHSSFESEFTCIYKDKHGQGVLLYRAKPTEHIHKFWTQLGNEYFKRENGYKEAMRNRVFKEFNFNWGGDE